MSVIKAICNKVAVLENGELIDSGRLEDVELPEDKFFWLNKENELKNKELEKNGFKEVRNYVG